MLLTTSLKIVVTLHDLGERGGKVTGRGDPPRQRILLIFLCNGNGLPLDYRTVATRRRIFAHNGLGNRAIRQCKSDTHIRPTCMIAREEYHPPGIKPACRKEVAHILPLRAEPKCRCLVEEIQDVRGYPLGTHGNA